MVFCHVEECVSGVVLFFFQAEDGIRDLVRSRGLGDVYKRQLFGIDRSGEGVACSSITVWARRNVGYRDAAPIPLSLIHI